MIFAQRNHNEIFHGPNSTAGWWPLRKWPQCTTIRNPEFSMYFLSNREFHRQHCNIQDVQNMVRRCSVVCLIHDLKSHWLKSHWKIRISNLLKVALLSVIIGPPCCSVEWSQCISRMLLISYYSPDESSRVVLSVLLRLTAYSTVVPIWSKLSVESRKSVSFPTNGSFSSRR